MFNQMSYSRSERVGELIHHEISNLLIKGIKDPRVKSATITKVEMSRDLKSARVFFSAPGEEQKEILKGLNSARGFIRAVLKKRLSLRYIPNLTIIPDKSIEHSIHISRVLDNLEYDSDEDKNS
ncbi:MAG: 30S ribosome-binding factor RbfA [bacterium]